MKPAGAGSLNYVADWVMDAIDDLIGRVEQDIVVETSIDPALQTAAEQALVDELAQKGDKFGVGQGALVAMTPDGVVRALVGGRNYAESQFNRAIAAKRQPGSAFKPFVYLTALEHGLTPDTVRDDKPIAVKGWKPENYGHEYFGPVTLTQALAHSLNTVSVRLTLEFGPMAVVAHRLPARHHLEARAQCLDRARHLGSLAARARLRLCAVRQWRPCGHAACRRARAHAPTARRSTRARRKRSAASSMARYVGDDERDAAARRSSPAPRARAELPGWQAAGKTGTSQDFRDAWFIGYTAHLVTGVWLGNDDNLADQKGDRRRPAGRNLEPVHEDGAPGRRAASACPASSAARRSPPRRSRRRTFPDRLPQTPRAAAGTTAASTSGCSTSCWAGADGARHLDQIVLRRSWFFSGSERMRLPVAAKIALHKAGASGGTGGSPMPPQKPPLGTSTVSTSGMSAMRSIS